MKIRGNFREVAFPQAAEFASRASGATVTYEIARRWLPHSELLGVEVFLYGDGTLNHRRSAHDRNEYAATRQQWGHFINHLFELDPDARIGMYDGRAEFDDQTRGAFPPVGQAQRREDHQ